MLNELTAPDIELLKFLSRYAVADIECIRTIYLSYGGRRYYEERISRLRSRELKYISLRSQQTTYTLLKKGVEKLKELGIEKSAWYSGSRKCLGRLQEVSKIAVLLMKAKIDVLEEYDSSDERRKTFIPSNMIKDKIHGIDRQSRFAGILFSSGGNRAVYDLGNGSRIWQPLSEYSIFKDGLRDNWKLDGMLLLADENNITDFAAKITITDLSPGRRTAAARSIRNPLRLWPGYKSCCLLGKSEAVFMIKLLTISGWKENIIADLFPDAELLGGNPIEPDCKYMNAYIYLLLDNDLLRAHFLRNYINAGFDKYTGSGTIHICCLESHIAIYTALFPDVRIIPVKISRLERIFCDGGNPSCG